MSNKTENPPALNGVGLTQRPDETKEAFAARCDLFRLATKGLTKSTSKLGLYRLLGHSKAGKLLTTTYELSYGLDHCDLWNKDGQPYCLTAHVHLLELPHLQKLVDLCKLHNLDLSVNSLQSWWSPGITIFVALTKRP